MAIRRMISRDPAEFRRFQEDMINLGKIRTGVYATPAGKRGRPEKLDRFRFTSPHESLIRAVADLYGGEVQPWSPDRDPNRKEWEVITDTSELPVFIVNGQNIDPTYEAWAAGRTCVRRCDGEWDVISQAPCLCNGPDRPGDPQKLCKITTRVKVMLQDVIGVGSWMYESHGENFATETGGLLAEMVARAPEPVRSLLRLELERRREPDREKGGFKTKEFFVARFYVTAATPQQALSGGEPMRAIEARPVSAPVPPPAAPTAPAPFDIEAKRPLILADVEACTTVEALNALRDKLIERGVTDGQVKDAWASKMNAVVAAAKMERPYRVLVTGSRTWTNVEELEKQLSLANMVHRGRMVLVHGDCPDGADAQAKAWARRNGVPDEPHRADWSQGPGAGPWRNQQMVDSRPDIVLSFNRGGSRGTEHCTAAAEAAGLKVLRFTDDTPIEREPVTQTPGMPLKEYRVGDTVTVGGIEFTKISDNPFPPGTPAHQFFGRAETLEEEFNNDFNEVMEGAVETTGPVLPDVPAGDYDADELYTMLMTGAGQQNPPLTTGELNSLILRTFPANNVELVGGYELARLRAGLKSGAVSWR